MTQKHTAASSRNQKIRKDSAGSSSHRTVSHKSENLKRMSTNKCKSCVKDNSRNVNPELKVKDFSCYYLSGPKGSFYPKYSVTSHAASCFAYDRENCSPTCSYWNNVQTNSCLQPPVATYNCRPGYADPQCASKGKPSRGDVDKHTGSDAARHDLKLSRKSSCSTLRDATVPRFSSTYGGRCYYEAYQISNTNLNRKKGVKFFNDEREEVLSRTSSRNAKLDNKPISGDKTYKPVHLTEETGNCYSRKIEHRKPIPSWSIKSFDDAKKPKLCEYETSRVGRVKNYRRILYNEGIDDGLVGRHSVQPHRPPSPTLPGKRSSKDWMCDDVIPCSYINKSKYHYHCQEEVNKRCYKHDGNDSIHVAERSRSFSAEEIPVILYRAPSIKLPKRVLASIRSIDGRTIL